MTLLSPRRLPQVLINAVHVHMDFKFPSTRQIGT
jgi:hypothetical protein